MANTDTGLGWSADADYLIENGPQYFGQLVASDYHPNTNVFPSRPSISDVVHGGATFQSNGTTYYIAVWCSSEGSYSGSLELAVFNPNGRTISMALICDTEFYMYYPKLYITDGTNEFSGNWNSGVRGTLDADTGLYVTNRNNIFWDFGVTWGTLTPGTAKVGSTLQDILNQFQPVVTDIYKLNRGYAVACFAKWGDFAPSTYWTPFLISTDENAVAFSTDGVTEYPYRTKAIQRYDGMTFYVSYIRGVDGDPNTTYPTFDANAEFIGPGSDKLSLNNVFALIASSEHANILVNETVDPYEDFGNIGEDAGEINPDPEDDDVDFDDLPTKSFATAGFCRIFNPDASDLNDLASYMWTDQTFLQTVINHLKQILENPIESIISLSMVPVQPLRGSTKVPVKVMFINTGVSMYPVTSQFVEVDCGTLNLQECYGGALDYNPYTRVQIYLPYIGIVQLDTDEVMAKTLHLKYNIDVVTGICCAEIKADNKLLYSFSGHCAVSQPITSADFSSYLNAAVAAAKVAVGVATGMASTTATAAAAELPPATPGKPQTSSAPLSLQPTALVPIKSSGQIGPYLGSSGWEDIPEQPSNGASWGEMAKPGNANTVSSTMGGKMVVQHSGGFSGNSGYLAKRRPYLIIIRPRIANPKNYAQHFGRTSMEYLNLGSCTGYTKVQSVHLSGLDATNPELSEISSLLKGGVLM